jgi:hypothetical protein
VRTWTGCFGLGRGLDTTTVRAAACRRSCVMKYAAAAAPAAASATSKTRRSAHPSRLSCAAGLVSGNGGGAWASTSRWNWNSAVSGIGQSCLGVRLATLQGFNARKPLRVASAAAKLARAVITLYGR